ncbi:MAG: hypothetical protein MUE46_16850 [Xanthomonadales bacterium]|jgi:uncharacterized membrane protein YqjE|nr:hypothetical protein [Xanthomonadales bacterium]
MHEITPEERARIEATARRARNLVIGALIGFTAMAVMILLVILLVPEFRSPDWRPVRTVLLTLATAAGVGVVWWRSRRDAEG